MYEVYLLLDLVSRPAWLDIALTASLSREERSADLLNCFSLIIITLPALNRQTYQSELTGTAAPATSLGTEHLVTIEARSSLVGWEAVIGV